MMSIQLLLVRQSIKMRFDKQGNDGWRSVRKILTLIIYLVHLDLYLLSECQSSDVACEIRQLADAKKRSRSTLRTKSPLHGSGLRRANLEGKLFQAIAQNFSLCME